MLLSNYKCEASRAKRKVIMQHFQIGGGDKRENKNNTARCFASYNRVNIETDLNCKILSELLLRSWEDAGNTTFLNKDEIKLAFDVESRSYAKILNSHTQRSTLSILGGAVAQGSFDRQTAMMTFLKCFQAHSRPAGHAESWRLYLESLTLQHVLFLCVMCIGRSKCWVNIAGCQWADMPYYTWHAFFQSPAFSQL